MRRNEVSLRLFKQSCGEKSCGVCMHMAEGRRETLESGHLCRHLAP